MSHFDLELGSVETVERTYLDTSTASCAGGRLAALGGRSALAREPRRSRARSVGLAAPTRGRASRGLSGGGDAGPAGAGHRDPRRDVDCAPPRSPAGVAGPRRRAQDRGASRRGRALDRARRPQAAPADHAAVADRRFGDTTRHFAGATRGGGRDRSGRRSRATGRRGRRAIRRRAGRSFVEAERRLVPAQRADSAAVAILTQADVGDRGQSAGDGG